MKKRKMAWLAGALAAAVWTAGLAAFAAQPGAFDGEGWERELPAKAVILMEAESGRVLCGKEIHTRLPMASTTKIMTTLLALEQPGQEEWFTVDAQAIQTEGSSMGLQEGDRVTLQALSYGMILPSGNDAANAAAVRISGSIPAFVERMNQRARELGLADTHYQNPSGLDAEGHYSSAYDLARLTRTALQVPQFAEICRQSSAKVCFGNPPYDRWLKNHNRLLELYPNAIGVKTGYTEDAYRCLVSASEKDGVTLICVTLNCAGDWELHEQLYEEFFPQITMTELALEGEETAPAAGDKSTPEALPLRLGASGRYPLLPGERIESQLLCPPVVAAPVYEGQPLGQAQFWAVDPQGRRGTAVQLPLAAAQSLEIDDPRTGGLIDRLLAYALQ